MGSGEGKSSHGDDISIYTYIYIYIRLKISQQEFGNDKRLKRLPCRTYVRYVVGEVESYRLQPSGGD